MTGLITDPRWISLTQPLLTLVLMIMGIGIMVGLVKPKQVFMWIAGIAIVVPVVTQVSSLIFTELRSNFGVLPVYILSIIIFMVMLIWKLFKFRFTREIMTHVISHGIYDFIVRPVVTSPFLWRMLLILAILFAGVALWFSRSLIMP